MLSKEWITLPLGDVVTFQRGYDLPGRLRNPGNVPIISSSGRGGNHNNSMVSGPGVITGRYGTIGKLFYIKEDYWPLNTTLFISNFHNNNPLFIFYLLQRIDFKSHSGKSGVPGVNRNDLHNEIITLPPTKAEQKAIAEALSDADGLIESLEQLIAKKRMIKQGSMQELLTGKKRLPGFSGEWFKCSLRSCLVADPDYGINAPGVPMSGDLPAYLRITDIDEHGRICRSNLLAVRNSLASNFLLEENDIVFARTGASVGKTYRYHKTDGELVFAGFLIRAKIDSTKLSPIFLSEFTRTSEYWNWVQVMSMRSGQPGINGNEYAALPLHLPPSLEEQTAIASILSDMDNEISALETKLAKARQVKQGMMQELLTGRVRLV